MDVRKLRYFVVVAEEGSLRAAARRLTIAQPPLSHAMQKLEQELGAVLFIRSSRGIELTRAGEVLLTEAREILRRVEDAVALVRGAAEDAVDTLRVGLVAGMAAAADLTAPILRVFQSRHPEFRLALSDLKFQQQVEAVVRGDVDIAVARPPYLDDRIELIPLFSEPRVLCVAADHPLADRDELSVHDVLDEPMLEFEGAPAGWSEFFTLDDVRGGPAEQRYPTSASTLTELQAVLASAQGALSSASSVWRSVLATPLLEGVPLPDAAPSAVCLAVAPGPRSAAVTAFIETAISVSDELIGLVPGGTVAVH